MLAGQLMAVCVSGRVLVIHNHSLGNKGVREISRRHQDNKVYLMDTDPIVRLP